MGRNRCLGFNTARVQSRESLKLIKENDWKQLCSTISPASACEELTRGLQGSSSWRFRVTVWFYFELSTSAIFSRGWISSFFNLNDTSVPWPYMTCNATCNKHILVSNALIYVLWIIIIKPKRISRHLCHIKHFSGHQESHLASTWIPALLTLIWLLLLSLLSQVLRVVMCNTRSPRLSLVWNISDTTTGLNKSGHCFLSWISSLDSLFPDVSDTQEN